MRRPVLLGLTASILTLAAFLAGVFLSPEAHRFLSKVDSPIPICFGEPTVVNGDTVRCSFRQIDLDYDAPETNSFKSDCLLPASQRMSANDATAWLAERLDQAAKDNATVTVQIDRQDASFQSFKGSLLIDGETIKSEIIDAGLACELKVKDWCKPTREQVCAAANRDAP